MVAVTPGFPYYSLIMNAVLRLAAWAGMLIGAAVYFQWNMDAIHLATIGVILAGMLLLRRWWKRRQSFRWDDMGDDESLPDNPVRVAALNCLVGLATVLLFINPAIVVLERAIAYDDRDLRQLEAKLQVLRSAADWRHAAQMAEERLQHRMSSLRRDALASNGCRDWVLAAQACAEPREEVECLERAIDLASRYKLDAQLAQTLLAQTRDQMRLDDKFQSLRNERKWSELAAMLEASLQLQPESSEKYAPLLLEAKVEEAKAESQTDKRHDLLRRAVAIADQYGMNPDAAQAMLREIELQRDVERRQRAAEAKVRTAVATLLEKQQFQELTAYLEFSMASSDPGSWKHPLAQWLHDAYLAWGDQGGELDAQQARYQSARTIATRHGLPQTVAEQRLADVQIQLDRRERESAPIDLPSGCTAGVVRLSTLAYPPVFVIEVFVENAAGAPIGGLRAKDFSVEILGSPSLEVRLAPFQDAPPATWIAILLDVSGSMRGAALDTVKSGTKAFLVRTLSEPNAFCQVMAFAGTTRQVTRWTAEYEAAAAAVNALVAEGQTGMFKALNSALDQLATRPGPRRQLLLFSDGRDNLGDGSPDAVIRRCRQLAITLHTIGLSTADLDVKLLQRLATETGGSYLEARKPTELEAHYKTAARRMRRDLYRLVVTPEETPSLPGIIPVRLRVGGQNAVSIEDTVTPQNASEARLATASP